MCRYDYMQVFVGMSARQLVDKIQQIKLALYICVNGLNDGGRGSGIG